MSELGQRLNAIQSGHFDIEGGTMSLKFTNLPFLITARLFNERFPKRDVVVQFVDGLHRSTGGFALTEFSTESGIPAIVTIDCSVPFEAALELLCHELAHVAVGADPDGADHGPEWKAIFDALYDDTIEQIRGVAAQELTVQAWKSLPMVPV